MTSGVLIIDLRSNLRDILRWIFSRTSRVMNCFLKIFPSYTSSSSRLNLARSWGDATPRQFSWLHATFFVIAV